jgi:cation-transporting ATPase E
MENNINLDLGLSKTQVEERVLAGKTNCQPTSKTKTIGSIIRDNTFTLFNILNIILALMVIFVESYQNLLFINIVIINTIIGIFQEIKAKKTIDQLTVISEPHVKVVREGSEEEIGFEKIVIDDLLILSAGKQIPADSEVIDGEMEVNESLLTGESEAKIKRTGDLLLSGSFVVSGRSKAIVKKVGLDNYATQLAEEVKKPKKPNSEIMRALKLIMKVISIVIVPIGLLLLYKQIIVQGASIEAGIVTTVAALIGMIPEGLVLLTSVALAIGIIRLGHYKTLVQELYCIETLARVDMLCLDKTGTITEGNIEVLSIEILDNDRHPVQGIRALVANMKEDNPTFNALTESFKGKPPQWQCEKLVSFSSARKWSGANFGDHGTYIIGAPEVILGSDYSTIQEKVEVYANLGNRVLMVGYSKKSFNGDFGLPEDIETIGLLPMGDKIRHDAKKTLDFFRNQGVEIKIISGDNPVTVSQVAKRAGLMEWDSYIDATTFETDEALKEAALTYSVFGRVTPDQKRLLVNTYKEVGHTVGMTGDGVNDVLALRDSDCGIAMGNGSDVTRQVAQLVLLDSNFANLTRVVMEGRRVINNITRASSLFLVKTMFSLMLAIIVIFSNEFYPFVPIQLTLISSLTIGIPAFFLALEPNKNRVTGNFLDNVSRKAFPGAMVIVLNIIVIMIIGHFFSMTSQQISTLSVIATGVTGLIILFSVSQPMDNKRWGLFFAMMISMFIGIFFFGDFFFLLPIQEFTMVMGVLLGLIFVDIYPLFKLFRYLMSLLEKQYYKWEKKKKTI